MPPAAMNCPDCQSPLEPQHVGAVEVDYCRTCKGAWFDRGELDAVRSATSGTKAVTKALMTDIRGGRCPRCPGESLLAGSVAMAAIACCPTCRGIWVPSPDRPPRRASGDASVLGLALEIVGYAVQTIF